MINPKELRQGNLVIFDDLLKGHEKTGEINGKSYAFMTILSEKLNL